MIYANLRTSQWGHFVKTDAYRNLDPSEKSAVSYFLGLSFAKLAGWELFRIEWLLHADVYADELRLLTTNGLKPDLVGESSPGEWYIFEAKGRSNGINNQLINRAKAQTAGLNTVCGSAPHLRIASITYFSNQSLNLHLEDPEEIHSQAADFYPEGGEDQFLKNYYQPFLDILGLSDSGLAREEITLDNRRLSVVELVDADVTIGLDHTVQRALNRDSIRPALREYLLRVADQPHESGGRTFTSQFMGPDGIFVGLGRAWSDR